MAEPLARLGARVTAIDADGRAIAIARAHAQEQGLKITYRQASPEQLAQGAFDLVLALEVIEHVAQKAAFLAAARARLRPGGLFILSTLNRSLRSYLLGVVAAERILGWVPAGTHDWRRFVRPSEMAQKLRKAGLIPRSATGLVYNPLAGRWQLDQRRLAINYFMTARKGENGSDSGESP